MIKAHTPINWENEPSYNTPINETNLNKMDSTIGVLDDRIIEQDTSKLDKTTAYTMVKDISFNENNGIFTVTRLNGSTFTIDTKLEKISINFDYNKETQQIEIILIDGTKQYIDISSLISPIDFVDSDTIGWEVTSDWKVKAKVLDGSITEDMLQPNYLAEIKLETEKSAQSMANAKISENNAKQSELNAKESEEKALEYSSNAQPVAQSVSGNNPTATNTTNGSLIYLNNKGYTQQDGTPTPDNPIHIGASADKGYFDGELRQGYRQGGSGIIYDAPNNITSSNLFNCNANDVIVLKYEDSITRSDTTKVPFAITFYDSNNTYITQSKSDNSVNEMTAIAPTNAKYFAIDIRQDTALTPTTAKHICVTINGMYAVRVKAQNKNMFETSKHIYTRTLNGITLTDNNDGTYTLNGNATADTIFEFWENFEVKNNYILSSTLLSGSVSDKTKVSCAFFQTSNWQTTATTLDSEKAMYAMTSNMFRVTVKSGVVCNNAKVGVMVRDTGDSTYEPYTEKIVNIPTSAPLYDGDYIEVYADGSGQIYRKNKSIVLNGSEVITVSSGAFSIDVDNAVKTQRRITSTHFKSIGSLSIEDGNTFISSQGKLIVCKTSTLEEFKTWLAENKPQFIYKLAEPVTEPLTAEQVAEFRKLQTFKGVTHITADGEVTVRYYFNNDNGDTVRMLQEQVNKLDKNVNYDYTYARANTGMKWLDGKPIYRKTIYIPTLQEGLVETAIDDDLERVIKIDGFAYAKEKTKHAIPLVYAGFYEDMEPIYKPSISTFIHESGNLRIISYDDKSNYEAYVTVEYTTTTD